ncbi:unnamed protein product [Gadus morhua 'NCC']
MIMVDSPIKVRGGESKEHCKAHTLKCPHLASCSPGWRTRLTVPSPGQLFTRLENPPYSALTWPAVHQAGEPALKCPHLASCSPGWRTRLTVPSPGQLFTRLENPPYSALTWPDVTGRRTRLTFTWPAAHQAGEPALQCPHLASCSPGWRTRLTVPSPGQMLQAGEPALPSPGQVFTRRENMEL